MKNTELRIGNLLYNGTVVGLTDHDITVYDGYTNWKSDKMEFEPIPLDEEWLIKMGLENRYGNTYFAGKLKFTYELNELSQFVRFHYSGKVVYLQYVHQFQNLYYALTQTELTLSK